ncbi:N-acetylmuramoyl-L-alanine amidase [Clostridium sp.]|uniref:N-acetylmuramoyl-L-alanine amidase n=1 Tax=Clostridium sp. TaxID=1506 RepID=UPI0039C6DC9A
MEDRKVKDSLIKYLISLGHEVLDVTPGNMNRDNDLVYGVSRANNWGADLFISIHFNKAYSSYNGAIGTETWVYSKSDNIKLDEEIALRIVNSIAGLGFNNRGVKEKTDLYELGATKMASIIVEVCFVEATEDVALYQKLGSDKIGQTIAYAISNKNLANEVPNIKKEENKKQVSYNNDEYRIKEYPEAGVFTCTVDAINFRNNPLISSSNPIQGQYYNGEKVNYDYVVITNKYVYISWISASAGVRRYMPVRDLINKEVWGTFV